MSKKDEKKKQTPATKEELEVISIYKEYNKPKNIFKKVVLVLVIVLYAFFFLSPKIFHEKAPVYCTEIGTWQKLTDTRQFKIVSWTYSPSQAMMEVQLEIDNNDLAGENTYDYYSEINYQEANKSTEEVPIAVRVEREDMVVIWIGNIPEKFNSCCLYVLSKDNRDKTLQLYTETNSVDRVDEISEKTENDYRADRIQSLLDEVQQSIQNNLDTIASNEEEIALIEAKILKIEENIKYQTNSEAIESQAIIDGYNQNILDLQTTNEKLIAENEEYQITVTEYEELIQRISNLEPIEENADVVENTESTSSTETTVHTE